MKSRRLVLSSIAVLLAACAPFQPVKVAPVKTYTLDAVSTKTFPGEAKSLKTLLVSKPLASPGFQSAHMVYRKRPYELKTFTVNRWVAPPADMIGPILTQSLRNTHHFPAVVSAPFAGVTDLRLETHLLGLYQDFQQKPSQSVVMIRVTLVNNLTNRIIGTRVFKSVVKTPKDDPYGGVLAANRATQNVMNQLTGFVVKLV